MSRVLTETYGAGVVIVLTFGLLPGTRFLPEIRERDSR